MVKNNLNKERFKNRLSKEAKDFDKINKERFKHVKSILINDERVEDYFYKNPWRYDFSRKYAFENIIKEFEKIKKGNNGGLNILDIGCGNGWFSINTNLENKNHWDCIDISQESISVANTYKDKFNLTKNSYYVNSLEDLERNKKYDIITCVNSLHHLTDLDLFYSKVKKYLKPNGQVFIYDVSPDLFSEINGSFVLLIRTLLMFTEKVKYFENFKVLDMDTKFKKILYEWQNEIDDLKKQSHNDHYHSTPEIISFLKNKFVEISYKQYGGILMRLLGGLRGDISLQKKLSKQLIDFEKLLINKKLINPYTYSFIGKLF